MFEYGNNLSTGGHIGNTIRSMDSNKASTGGFQSVFNGAPFDIAAQVNNVFNNLSDEMACWLLPACLCASPLFHYIRLFLLLDGRRFYNAWK